MPAKRKKGAPKASVGVGIHDASIDTDGGDIVGRDKLLIKIENFHYSTLPTQPPQAIDDGTLPPCPYPGLAYFGPQDAASFFGRDAAIKRLEAAITHRALTALVGASGSGKSSVVLAGLAPRLHAQGGWRFTHFRIGTEPSKNPFLALARALVPLYVESDSDTERLKNTRNLATSLQTGDLTLSDVFADCRSRNKATRILLIADQFEEALTFVDDEKLRHRFMDVLLAGFANTIPGGRSDVCLILTMRGDFYGQALRYRPCADALQDHIENLGPMNRDELRAAIITPAHNAKVSFESGLVETLLDQVESKPGSLPLLQFTLREMWGRLHNRRMTRSSYDAIGGVEGALAQRAETIYGTLSANGTDMHSAMLFRRLFMRLVTFGEGAEDTRRIVGREELGEETWALAQRLADQDNRLVVTSAQTPGHETAEVVHEALIRNWPTLKQWVDHDREFQSWLQQLRPRVDEWRKSPTDEGTLLRGGPLAVADEWLARCSDEFSKDERTFITASIEFRKTDQDREQMRLANIAAGQRRTARLQRYLIAALACVVAGLVGWVNQSFLLERLNWYFTMRPYALNYVWPYLLTADAERALKPQASFRECARDCPEMVVVRAGEFMMGSAATDPSRYNDEGPQHKVTIAKPFAVSKTDVTFAEWDACVSVGGCPQVDDSRFGRGPKPVINVTWDEAQQYVAWLSKMTRQPYRLLTEAEWEYAARAATITAYYWGDEIGMGNANCVGCGSAWDGRGTSPVGSFKPNAFGLYDMAGNVWQWVQDCVHDDYDGAPTDGSTWAGGDCNRHVIRGGSWNYDPRILRVAIRGRNTTVGRIDYTGIRVARTILPQ